LAVNYRRAVSTAASTTATAASAAANPAAAAKAATATAATAALDALLPGASPAHVPAPETVLFYSVRPSAGPVAPLVAGHSGGAGAAASFGTDLPLQPHDPALLGQVDGVEGGIASGWACVRGGSGGGKESAKGGSGGSQKGGPGASGAASATGAATRSTSPAPPLLVSVYVDGVHVGDAEASGPTPHPLVHRLCSSSAGDSGSGVSTGGKKGSVLAAGTMPASSGGLTGVGWTVRLPPLPQGRHELRAYAANPARTARQELAQSPLPFLETAASPDPAAALARKDAIIRVRNAQVAALWDELHTRQPWRNALADDGSGSVSFGGGGGGGGGATVVGAGGNGDGKSANATSATATSPPYTAVLAINTGLGARARRDALRRTWVPSAAPGGLAALEARHRVVIRFFVGYSAQADDPVEAALAEEAAQYGDIVRLDHVDTYADLSAKTLKLFTLLPSLWDAAFYFKVDDDVALNVPALAAYLDGRRGEGNLYLGCMKSGAVLTDRRYKWFEPEWWRFGDPAAPADGTAPPAGASINYPRHASGQLYGLSGPVARYLARAGPVLHRFANEDVTLGAWLLGLEVAHVDERRLCCDSPDRCASQTGPGNVCLGYFEMACAGICAPDKRLEPLYHACLADPLHMPRGQMSDLLSRVPPWDVNLLGGGGGGDGGGAGGGGQDEAEVEVEAKADGADTDTAGAAGAGAGAGAGGAAGAGAGAGGGAGAGAGAGAGGRAAAAAATDSDAAAAAAVPEPVTQADDPDPAGDAAAAGAAAAARAVGADAAAAKAGGGGG